MGKIEWPGSVINKSSIKQMFTQNRDNFFNK